jgi:hypothetical protein
MKGAGFSGGVSLLKGKPCPQDVPGGVHVRVSLMAACKTQESRLGDTVARCRVSTLRAPLRGVTGIDCDHCPPRAFSLGGQNPQEDAPSRVADRFAQVRLGRCAIPLMAAVAVRAWLRPGGHVRDLEFFVHDQVVAADDGQSGLVRVVQTLATNLPVQPGRAAVTSSRPTAAKYTGNGER